MDPDLRSSDASCFLNFLYLFYCVHGMIHNSVLALKYPVGVCFKYNIID